MTDEQLTLLASLAQPLMQFLAENGTPHDCIIIRANLTEYMVGVAGVVATAPKDGETKQPEKA